MKLFSKSFEECRLFEKRRRPKTFILYQGFVFPSLLREKPAF
ncbi:hypothetical protein SXCC_01226 [Gluconacetobacter sp. SXCC-1]|nr:hypothetical protein SXCC_01226 [Gluconacetobacter sp. SXCC-1]